MDEHPNPENICLSVVENDNDNDNVIDTSSNNSSDDSQIPKVNDVDGYTQPIITSDKSQQNKILLASLLYHINQRKAKQQINNEKKHMITKNKYTNEELVSIIEQNKRKVYPMIKSKHPKPHKVSKPIYKPNPVITKPSVIKPVIQPSVTQPPVIQPVTQPRLFPINGIENINNLVVSPWINSGVIPNTDLGLNVKNRSFDIRGDYTNADGFISKSKKQESKDNIFKSAFKDIISESTINKLLNEPNINNIFNETNLTNIMNDFKSANVTDIKSFLTKIEQNSKIQQNTDNTELVLINFEDDTFRPVIKINEKYINIIKKWYDTCNQLIDIEDTDIIIPKEININDISMILFKNMNCKHKDVFINEYIPKILNYIVLQNKIFNIESEMCISVLTTTSKVSIKKTQTLDELGITIPDNINYMEEYFYKKDKKISNYKVKKEPKSKPKLGIKGENSFNKNELHGKMIEKIDEDTGGVTISCDDFELSKKMSINYVPKVQPLSDKYSIIQYLNNDGLTAYNNDIYGGGNYFSLEEEKAEKYENEYKEDLTKFKLIIVLINVINPLFFQTVTIVDPDLDTLTSVFEYTEYGFIELFTIKTDNDEIELFINKQYNGNIYNNSTEINESLVSTSQYIEFSNNKLNNNKQLLEEEKSVKHYLNTYYNITNDIEHKIKAKVLYDTLIKEKLCVIDKTKLAGFKNRLSNYLKELNLQKKRYSDGYYYYGIVKKEPENNIQENNKELRNITDIMEERNNLYREMTTNSNDFYRLK